MVLRKNLPLNFTKKEEILKQSKHNYSLEELLHSYRFKGGHRQIEGSVDKRFLPDKKIYDRENLTMLPLIFRKWCIRIKGSNELTGAEEMGSKCAL